MLLAFQMLLFLAFLLFFLFLIYSIIEKENRAVKRTLPIIFLIALLFIISTELNLPALIYSGVLVIAGISIIILVVRFGNNEVIFEIPAKKFDERNIMFSRMELKEGSSRFEEYYQRNKNYKAKDDLFRKEPGLLSPKSKYYNQWQFGAASATFSAVDLLHPLVEGKAVSVKNRDWDVQAISNYLKKWTIKLGAVDVGFTLVKPHHMYSHSGRGNNYGNPVQLNHKYAIAFTVEMDFNAVSQTPKGPIIMESAQQYLNAGTIAVQVAEFIRNLGFDARAHIDANYKLICPIVAQDAGLGVIGRMGLLITPKLGPRVRIGVITTDLELEINNQPIESSVIHFCNTCKKCAHNCPSLAIPNNEAVKNKSCQRWTINHEKCFTYWTKAGTDCGRCITVCPYSHPNNLMHNFIRWMIKRNHVNRWFALRLDDYFYGRKPTIKQYAEWMKPK